jgi:hypothetical protein
MSSRLHACRALTRRSAPFDVTPLSQVSVCKVISSLPCHTAGRSTGRDAARLDGEGVVAMHSTTCGHDPLPTVGQKVVQAGAKVASGRAFGGMRIASSGCLPMPSGVAALQAKFSCSTAGAGARRTSRATLSSPSQAFRAGPLMARAPAKGGCRGSAPVRRRPSFSVVSSIISAGF